MLVSDMPADGCPGCRTGRLSGVSCRPRASLSDPWVSACTRSPSVFTAPSRAASGLCVLGLWNRTGVALGRCPSHHITHCDFPDLQERSRVGEPDRGEAEQWCGVGVEGKLCL